MSAPASVPDTVNPVLSINATYNIAPGTDANALLEDAIQLADIVEDIINTVAWGLTDAGDMSANLKPTANLLFGARILQQLAQGALGAAHVMGRGKGGEV